VGWIRGIRKAETKERNFRKQGDKGSHKVGIDVHVGIQRRFLNAELNDVSEAHGDFRLHGGKFRQWISEKARRLKFDIRI
jgi:hypothetical protein